MYLHTWMYPQTQPKHHSNSDVCGVSDTRRVDECTTRYRFQDASDQQEITGKCGMEICDRTCSAECVTNMGAGHDLPRLTVDIDVGIRGLDKDANETALEHVSTDKRVTPCPIRSQRRKLPVGVGRACTHRAIADTAGEDCEVTQVGVPHQGLNDADTGEVGEVTPGGGSIPSTHRVGTEAGDIAHVVLHKAGQDRGGEGTEDDDVAEVAPPDHTRGGRVTDTQ